MAVLPRRPTELPLPDGSHAIVDYTDAIKYKLNEHLWCLGGPDYKYVQSRINGRIVYLHRLVSRAGEKDVVRFRNGDTRDCRSKNIRHVPHATHMKNLRMRRRARDLVRSSPPITDQQAKMAARLLAS